MPGIEWKGAKLTTQPSTTSSITIGSLQSFLQGKERCGSNRREKSQFMPQRHKTEPFKVHSPCAKARESTSRKEGVPNNIQSSHMFNVGAKYIIVRIGFAGPLYNYTTIQ